MSKRKTHFKQQHFSHLASLRRYPKPSRDKKVLCQRENIKVSLLEKACAFWEPHTDNAGSLEEHY